MAFAVGLLRRCLIKSRPATATLKATVTSDHWNRLLASRGEAANCLSVAVVAMPHLWRQAVGLSLRNRHDLIKSANSPALYRADICKVGMSCAGKRARRAMKRTDFGLRVFFGTRLSAAAALRAITGSAFAAYPRMAFQNNKTRKTVQSFFHFIISGFLIAGMYGHGSSMRKSIIGGVDMKEPIAAFERDRAELVDKYAGARVG